MYVIIDTEGSGLFDFSKPADAEGQPRLAQLAMIYADAEFNIEREYSAYVKPDGWTMDPKATAVNGLTDEILNDKGVPVSEVLAVYTEAIKEGRAVVAFNAQHDCKTMRAELRRAGMPDLFEETKNVCVMRKANGIIPKAGGKKGWPKLSEARTHLGLKTDEAHTATADAMDAWHILKYLAAHGADLTPEVHYAANHPSSGDAK
jgi:DNA polymerase III epsilon subunit-like protein